MKWTMNDTVLHHFCFFISNLGEAIHRPVCFFSKLQDENILHLESTSYSPSNRCHNSIMEKIMFGYAFSLICLIPKILEHI